MASTGGLPDIDALGKGWAPFFDAVHSGRWQSVVALEDSLRMVHRTVAPLRRARAETADHLVDAELGTGGMSCFTDFSEDDMIEVHADYMKELLAGDLARVRWALTEEEEDDDDEEEESFETALARAKQDLAEAFRRGEHAELLVEIDDGIAAAKENLRGKARRRVVQALPRPRACAVIERCTFSCVNPEHAGAASACFSFEPTNDDEDDAGLVHLRVKLNEAIPFATVASVAKCQFPVDPSTGVSCWSICPFLLRGAAELLATAGSDSDGEELEEGGPEDVQVMLTAPEVPTIEEGGQQTTAALKATVERAAKDSDSDAIARSVARAVDTVVEVLLGCEWWPTVSDAEWAFELLLFKTRVRSDTFDGRAVSPWVRSVVQRLLPHMHLSQRRMATLRRIVDRSSTVTL